jgi:hypothetical protein
MTHHRVTIKGALGGPRQAVCKCGQHSPVGPAQEVEDWCLAHAVEVQRVRAHLRGASPSLATTHAWYERQAANPDNTEGDRALWRQLADELHRRLGSGNTEQLTLWEDT